MPIKEFGLTLQELPLLTDIVYLIKQVSSTPVAAFTNMV